MQKTEMMYEGKAKKVYATNDPAYVIVSYKDDATAFNGEKKGQIADKGVFNNAITTALFKLLEEKKVPTHFVEKLDDRDQLCKAVTIVPLEVIVRNVIAGSMSKRLGIEEGTEISNTIFEICYKNDDLGDPLINDHHAVAMGLSTYEELKQIYAITADVNRIMTAFFDKQGIRLIDFKLEFGKTADGTLLLADEISPDTCRFWDKETGQKLDKDRFRRDLGNIQEAYKEILSRVEKG
ncbi:phosphoribosylaminoimidazolesuccinocarboxamide synthase [Oceanispirochaeta sp. M2]|nr:phosphoribosylaminoimidazolesuccinocarboxamide synthase [Oceanispirochaeta sp. M1]MBF9015575.1 phosphoribosylaminoimidazolesuccinocarboxamide synthase [Oceanispirochaeta sp. M2]NPD73936.1 phosphoribosylaminoimidazolesuccinocarboxamide synthase [Oceanispirochaeta sp. M1]RDG30289.1 phosphoribosylaminoimidazolesuccinocarboxamide synthase [Oceanispirochaeta sp. M1]